MNLDRLIELFEGLFTLKDDVIRLYDPRIPPELRDAWEKAKATATDEATLLLARRRIAEGLAMAFRTLTEGHSEPGKHSVHAG